MNDVTYTIEPDGTSTGGYWCNECQRQIFDSYHFCLSGSNYLKQVRQGWQCPICKVVHSPDINQCRCCVNPYTINIFYG